MKTLPRSFYLRPALKVAQELLGKYFIRRIGAKLIIGKIVEVEAYCESDPASHTYHGITNRNKVMFGEGGHLYVYFTYGMHYCSNVVTEIEGRGEAVLIRAVEPIAGIEVMMKNRFPRLNSHDQRSLFNLTNGPAKFCQAFGIARKENGMDLLAGSMTINNGPTVPFSSIKRTARIGIRSAMDKKWRFYINGNPWVSK